MTRAIVRGLCLAVLGCEAESTEPVFVYEGPPIPWDYAPFPELVEPASNVSTDAKIALGRLLFYDPVLGRDEKTACATCHSEQWGFSDGLALSVGVDGEGPTGPGREGPNVTPRNAPTLWNVAWKESLFWDGRSSMLELQALDPLNNELELDLPVKDAVERLRAIPAYVELFDEAFPDAGKPRVTGTNIAKALSAFERTFITNFAPYDQYVGGDEGALTEESKQGMVLFHQAGCSSCHVPPLFDSERFEARIATDDVGRFKVTGDEADRGKMRVPTLRNLRETGPYFHDGSTVALEEAVLREATRAAEQGEGQPLSEAQAALVSVFLRKALMSRANEPTRPDEVPSGLAVPLDGFRIPR